MLRKSARRLGLFLGLVACAFLTNFTVGLEHGADKNTNGQLVWVEAVVDHNAEMLTITATGPAGEPAQIEFNIVPGEAPQSPGVAAAMPITFDANGEAEVTFNLDLFDQLDGFIAVFNVTLPGAISEPRAVSNPWVFRLQRYPTGPGAPTLGGDLISAAIPGTVAPLFPTSWVAMLGSPVVNVPTEQDVMYFTCFRPGVEGVLPVH